MRGASAPRRTARFGRQVRVALTIEIDRTEVQLHDVRRVDVRDRAAGAS